MFSTLIASRPARAQSTHATAVSLFVHGAIVTAVIAATAAQPELFDAPGTSRVVPMTLPTTPRPAAEPPRSAPARPDPAPTAPVVAPPTPLAAPSDIPTTIPEPSTEPWTPVSTLPVGLPSGEGDPVVGGSPVSGGDVLGATQVDVPAALRQNSPLPRYPDLLRTTNVEGRVHARFVVGPNGRAELGTLEIVNATHPAFAEAVRAVLPRLQFTPARVGRRAVRQMVEIPFGFELTRR